MATTVFFEGEIKSFDGNKSAEFGFGTVAGPEGETLYFEIEGEMIALDKVAAKEILCSIREAGERLRVF